jgi:2-C-methyl-D-erythritol 2,4-cyclodiphosphate synthase
MVGIGYDIHRLESGNSIILGGVEIPADFGVAAHSDGDVLVHSIIDAMLGAAGLGDIGDYFPDTDERYKNANSCDLLKIIFEMLKSRGYEIVNIDATIVLERPKLADYKVKIKENLVKLLDLSDTQINIKATTNEKLDSIGTKSAIAVFSVCELRVGE